MPHVPTRPRPRIRHAKLPKDIADAGALRIERRQPRGIVIDVLDVPERPWEGAHHRYDHIKLLLQLAGLSRMLAAACLPSRW
jgi:hypothetical protein